MKYRYLILILFCSWTNLNGLAQTPEVDSLIQILPNLEGKKRIQTLNRLTWVLRTRDLEKAQKYGEEAIKLAEKDDEWEELSTAYSFTGIVFRNRENYVHALNYFYRALKIAEVHELPLQIAYSHNNIGDIFQKQDKNERAKKSIEKAIQFFQKVDNKRGESYGLIRLGEIYHNQQKYSKALEIYAQCYELRKEHMKTDTAGFAAVYERIGEVYELMEEHDEALLNYRRAWFFAQQVSQGTGMAVNQCNIARILYKSQKHKIDSAIYYGEESLKLAQKIGLTEAIRASTQLLSQIYGEQGKYEKAYELTKLFSDAQGSLIDEKTDKTLQIMAIEYQGTKQGATINLLEQNKYLLWSVTIVLVLVVFMTFFWIRYMRKLARLRAESFKKMQAQKQEIEAQAENLAQVNYAIENQKLDLETKNETLETTLTDLENAQTQVAESEKMASLGHMVAGISDELNNPLNFIYTGTESLQSILEDLTEILIKCDTADTVSIENLPQLIKEIQQLKYEVEYDDIQEDIKNLLADIYDGAKDTNRIVAGLRTFTESSSKAPTSIDIHQSLDATLIVLNHKLSDTIEIKKSYNSKLPYITCFSGLINQVLMNVLSYCIDATGVSGKIQIKTQKSDNEHIRIEIKHDGKSISEETRLHLFEPLQAKKEIAETESISFSITADIIQKHNGKIEVESQPNKGTTFKISLPIFPKFQEL